ncbi:MAG: hypothetical protein ACOZB3_01515 [Calditrichota bacterium]
MAMLYGGSCDVGGKKVLAGSRYIIKVDNEVDRPERPLTPGWPEGYRLEAALDRQHGQSFSPTPGLMERLDPQRLLSQVNQMYDNWLRNHEDVHIDESALNMKEFVLTIPANLAGHSLSFRAIYEGNGEVLESLPTKPVQIIAPCDSSDIARIIASRIFEAWRYSNCHMGVAIADSMLACGLSDPAGWDWAQSCARSCGEWDKAIVYLDKLYADYGTPSAGLDPTKPPRLHRSGPISTEAQELYLRLRNHILIEKAEFQKR